MTLLPEWKEQIQALSYAELIEEIKKEETSLGESYKSLYDADERVGELEEEIDRERQRDEAKRFLERQRTIERLRRRIEDRKSRIDDLTRRALEYERMPPYVSTVNRYIRLEVAASLWRTVSALEGWQTREQRSLRAYRGWQRREEALTERIRQLLTDIGTWRREAERLAAQIRTEEAKLAYKKSIIPPIALSRVTIALYLIIEGGEHEYPRDGETYTYHKPRFRRARTKVRYPKGRFQSILQCDTFTDPATGEIKQDIDPFKTLEQVMRQEVAEEFIEEFSLKELNPDDLTLGEVSLIPAKEEMGKPPFKLYISRTDTETGREWRTTINRYIMSDTEYYNLTRNMKDYIAALEAMG